MDKSGRLRRLATPEGVIAALAVDQRKSLRTMIAHAAGVPSDHIPDRDLAAFKAAVTRVLTPYASAVLIDPEFGQRAFAVRASQCGLIATYELDGYENPRPHRMLALMPRYSVRRLRDLGADAVKVLLSYTPFDDDRANDEKRAMVERIGAECAALDMPFFLEPVGYDETGAGPVDARRRPEIVLASIEEFSKDRYGVDVLKVEFPVDVLQVDLAYTRDQAVEWFRRVDAAARRPYIYLSAGVSTAAFLDALRFAADAGARFSGVLCGRATWQEGVPVFAREGVASFERWLARDGVRNMQTINELLRTAVPWQHDAIAGRS
jgi:tagatose 1,6-diphosphate aldolase